MNCGNSYLRTRIELFFRCDITQELIHRNTDSEALQAASRVVAVADERTNALVVSAPDEYMPTIPYSWWLKWRYKR